MTWATSVPILVFLGLFVLDLGPMYATDVRQTDVRQHHRFMPQSIRGGGIISVELLAFLCSLLNERCNQQINIAQVLNRSLS